MARYAEVQIEMVCADRVVDFIQEGFDVAVRAGHLEDSALTARSLGALRSYVVASPAFLKKNGSPKDPRDLERFDCVVFGAGVDRSSWKLNRKRETLTVSVKARLIVNDFDFLDEAAQSGLGIAMLPVFRCIESIRTKRLERVLPEWCSPEVPLHAVYPSTRHLSPKVNAFLDHLREHLTLPPWELGPVP